jgi:hypothetical protein
MTLLMLALVACLRAQKTSASAVRPGKAKKVADKPEPAYVTAEKAFEAGLSECNNGYDAAQYVPVLAAEPHLPACFMVPCFMPGFCWNLLIVACSC